jgi:hypothetical protein
MSTALDLQRKKVQRSGSAALGSGRIYRDNDIENRSEASGATLDAESP